MEQTTDFLANDYGIRFGDRFGRLQIIERVYDRKDCHGHNFAYFLCQCDCGNTKIIQARSLYRGHTNSCGCLQKDKLMDRNLKHGIFNFQTYKSYKEMIDRCYNENCHNYIAYGNKGISVCEDWYNPLSDENINLECLRNFHNWAITHPTYKKGYTVDRLDYNGNYCPENCIWSSSKEQANNRSNNRLIDYNGDQFSIAQIANILGIDNRLFYQKIVKANYDISALFVPYTFPDGSVSNVIMYRKTASPIPINAVYYIDQYGRPITEQQYEENINRLTPAIWSVNNWGFITGPILE